MEKMIGPSDQDSLQARVVKTLRGICDPEIPVNIYDLGLIYELDVQKTGEVHVSMTLTAPNCPVAQGFPETIRDALLGVPGVSDVQVDLVWEPPWSQEKMSEAARLQLGLM